MSLLILSLFSYRGYGRTAERGKFPLEYWQVLAAKLAFIYVFEVGVFGGVATFH